MLAVQGDEVLVLVARIMRSALRSDDRLYRFGGEEFVVMLDASDDAGARVAFERLQSRLRIMTRSRMALIGGMVSAKIELHLSSRYFIQKLPDAVPLANYLIGLGTLDERMLILMDIEQMMTAPDMGLIDDAGGGF